MFSETCSALAENAREKYAFFCRRPGAFFVSAVMAGAFIALGSILIFMLSGFEHSIANMAILGLALLEGAPLVSPAAYAGNILLVTLGNFVGGFVFVAVPYWFVSMEKC